jgi:hypothetical protein
MSGTTFTPIHPNPYIVGNPVRDPRMFFGRKQEFQFVLKRFQSSERGGLLVFCGERRSGKTSILFQIFDGCLGSDFLPVLIDMQALAMENEVDFLSKITSEIVRTAQVDPTVLCVPQYGMASKPASAFLEFTRELLRLHPHKKVILLFDEYELFEAKIESEQFSRDILHAFSNLMENHPVYFVFTGSQHLEQRRKDYWQILGKSLYQRVSYLHKTDAIQLITSPLRDEVSYLDGTVERIYRLSAGQPFYTQAICQSVVDSLNERRTREVTPEIVDTVVEGLIDNPLPQMIFLWDGLATNNKLALALLAEGLEGPESFATAEDLVGRLRRNRYPLDHGRAEIATALEELFREELLTKSKDTSAGYAFRMDMWRKWIQRMHSVWQVIAEVDIPIRPRVPRYRRPRYVVPAALGAALAVGVLFSGPGRKPVRPEPPPPVTAGGVLWLETHPPEAAVYYAGELAGTGRFERRLDAQRDHEFKVTAPGYVDTSFVITLGPDEESRRTVVAMRPITGALRVTTEPTAASITVDGSDRGRSPLTAAGLAVIQRHEIVASLAGYETQRVSHEVTADTTRTVLIRLAEATLTVDFDTTPPGARISLDGVVQEGRTPVRVENIRPGERRRYWKGTCPPTR